MKKYVEIFTDGACSGNPGPGGWGVVLRYGTKEKELSGIAAYYTPEQMIGKKVIIVANLKPAKLCGIESQGMILASGEEDVRVVFLADDTPLGERVR